MATQADVIKFWDSRATLGEASGTNDVILKRLEVAELVKRVPKGSRVLDAGCGNGLTLAHLQYANECTGIGIDASPGMTREASTRWSTDPGISFQYGNVVNRVTLPGGPFDVAISERCLINLESFDQQKRAFENTMSRLRPGGLYFMIENFTEGLDALNECRKAVDLPPMEPAWHNLYFSGSELLEWWRKDCLDKWDLAAECCFASTYMFLSRVVNAKLNEGKSLAYDSDINMLALKLPSVGNFGATQLWVWQKR